MAPFLHPRLIARPVPIHKAQRIKEDGSINR